MLDGKIVINISKCDVFCYYQQMDILWLPCDMHAYAYAPPLTPQKVQPWRAKIFVEYTKGSW